MQAARDEFDAFRCNDEQTIGLMRACYEETGYMLDPHTAVGLYAGMQLREEPSIPLVALACAHPAKFPDAVEKAVGVRPELPAHLADLHEREEFMTSLPNDLEQVKKFIQENVSQENVS